MFGCYIKMQYFYDYNVAAHSLGQLGAAHGLGLPAVQGCPWFGVTQGCRGVAAARTSGLGWGGLNLGLLWPPADSLPTRLLATGATRSHLPPCAAAGAAHSRRPPPSPCSGQSHRPPPSLPA